ncbi:gonadal somatic cell derived factor [Melanotaenia boesemani]|uniref:gonadal somatic cell derived factor n=1 Tax=Melanotaenia boesemani TaxID=1250792 RepID=UPI001C03CAD1|nr:gonadal somatic cell derived factor [Melanotaenia boesemani]
MYFKLFIMMMFLGSSMVIAFVLHPPKEDLAASAHAPVPHHRCLDESLQSIRKGLLAALNMQTEPQLPAGFLDSIQEQWQSTFGSSQFTQASKTAARYSVMLDGGNNTSLKCCHVASEIFMKDLGWDNWVIHPLSLTIVQCALCNSENNVVQCPSSTYSDQSANSQDQVPCCQPTSQETVPIAYMDETSSIVLSSMQLPRSCGCGPGNTQQPNKE